MESKRHVRIIQRITAYRRQVDDYLKKMAQEYFERHYGSRDEFMEIFGRSYL